MGCVSLQLLQLLLKASQDKRFVCEEAERTLIGMTTSISPQPMLQKLQPYVSHRNPRVRAKAAVCVYKSVSRLVSPFDMSVSCNNCWEFLLLYQNVETQLVYAMSFLCSFEAGLLFSTFLWH
jgi:hypothetical protein